MARSTVAIRFTGDVGDLKRAIGEVDGSLQKVGDAGKKATVAIGAGLAGVAVGAFQAVDAASDLAESMSKVEVVFGSGADAVEAWADKAATSLGMSKQAALEAAGTFGNFLIAMGAPEEAAQSMSTNLVQLASDLASFNNANPEEVLLALRSGLAGEAEPLRKFGVSLSAARIEAEGLKVGINKAYNEMSAAEKSTLAYQVIMEDTALAQGDFARTSDGMANKQRILSAQFQDMKARVGSALIPAMSALVDVLARKVLPAVEALGNWMARNKGVVAAAGAVIGTVLVAAFASWAVSAAAAAAATVAALAPVIAITAGVAALVAGIIYAYNEWDAFRDAVQSVARFLSETLWPALQTVVRFITDQVVPVVARLIEAWVGFHVKIAEIIVDVIRLFDDVVAFVGGLAGRMASAAGDLWGWATSGLESIKNTVVGAFEGAVNGIIAVLNLAIKAYNAIPLVGNIDTIDPVSWRDDEKARKSSASSAVRGLRIGLASGGIIKARPGGVPVTAAEAGEDEVFAPLSRFREMVGAGKGAGVVIHIDARGAVMGPADLDRWVAESLSRARKMGYAI